MESGKYTRRFACFTSEPRNWAQKIMSVETFRVAFELALTEPFLGRQLFEACSVEDLGMYHQDVSDGHHALLQIASTYRECMLCWRIATTEEMCHKSLLKAISLADIEAEREHARSMMRPIVRESSQPYNYRHYFLGGGSAIWDS